MIELGTIRLQHPTSVYEARNKVRSLADALEQQYTAAWTAVRFAAENREALLRDYDQAHRVAIAAGSEGTRWYFLGPDGDPGLRREAVDLLRGGAIEARPLVGWRAGGLYLTAVKLTNRTEHPRTLDPRDLRGTWLTATFQHHRLLPKGDEADTTAVYLISARPFDVSR